MNENGEKCLMDEIWLASHSRGYESVKAAVKMAEKFEGEDLPLENGAQVEVDCGRCGASFILQKTQHEMSRSDMLSVTFHKAGKKGIECDSSEVREPRLEEMGNPGERLGLGLFTDAVAEKTGLHI
ncbi:MAG TPA: hypothetical protein VFK11_01020 [Candidatus Saccharimonadales bacterium]|nr:hypothetical protein [Candidatus Saccharimonadales bacterium]